MILHIIGAGPAGLLLARECSELFDEVYLYEEHQSIGEPEHCTGIVSEKITQLVPLSRRLIMGRYRRIIVLSENLRLIAELKLREMAIMLNRREFERELARELERRGNIRIMLGERALLELRRDVPVILMRNRTIRCSDAIIAVCEGSIQRIASQILGYYTEDFVYGLQCDVRLRKRVLDPSTIIVLLSRRFSHRYFAWIVPLDYDEARLGVGYARGPGTAYLSKLMKITDAYRVGKIFGGKILLSSPPPRLGQGRIVFVGDSVSQVKPLTGGGVLLIALTSKLLRSVIRVAREIKSADSLGEIYSSAWHRVFQRYIRGVYALRRIIYSPIMWKVLCLWPSEAHLTFSVEDFDAQSRYIFNFRLSSYGHNFSHLLKELSTLTF